MQIDVWPTNLEHLILAFEYLVNFDCLFIPFPQYNRIYAKIWNSPKRKYNYWKEYVDKICGKKINCSWIMNNFSFSQNIFVSCLLQMLQNASVSGKQLTLSLLKMDTFGTGEFWNSCGKKDELIKFWGYIVGHNVFISVTNF